MLLTKCILYFVHNLYHNISCSKQRQEYPEQSRAYRACPLLMNLYVAQNYWYSHNTQVGIFGMKGTKLFPNCDGYQKAVFPDIRNAFIIVKLINNTLHWKPPSTVELGDHNPSRRSASFPGPF